MGFPIFAPYKNSGKYYSLQKLNIIDAARKIYIKYKQKTLFFTYNVSGSLTRPVCPYKI